MLLPLGNIQIADMGFQALAVVVGLVIGFTLLFIRNHRNRKNQPAGEHRERLIEELVRMHAEGAGFHDRLAYLRQQGLRDQVAEGLIIDADTESIPNDLGNPKAIERPWCSFQAPGNWRLIPLGDQLSQEYFFCIEAAGSGIVSFSCSRDGAQSMDPEQVLQDALQGLGKQLRQLEIGESISSWGNLQGKGLRVTGAIKSHPVSAAYTLFVMQHQDDLISIQQGGLEASQSRHQAAYDLIASSFRFLP